MKDNYLPATAEQELDAKRWRFLLEHWHSTINGKTLPRWVDDHALDHGGVAAALDFAICYHEGSERHIAGSVH